MQDAQMKLSPVQRDLLRTERERLELKFKLADI